MVNKLNCSLCPRKCDIDRMKNVGFCGVGVNPIVAKACLHFWEEPCISGSRGSGTVFFSGCSLKCIYCQNSCISQENYGKEISIERLSQIFIELQNKGAHNINLVNPGHCVPAVREALLKKELDIPVVYNTGSYENTETLRLMEGLVNIYLPDIKYFSSEVSLKYSKASDYFKYAALAVQEMYRQVRDAEFDTAGIMLKGMIIRHLILPGQTKESIKILDWIKDNIPQDIHLSLMSQYTPFYKAGECPELNRRITRWEYDKVLNHFYKLGFKNGYIQERNSADEEYIPDFNLEGI